MNQAPTPVNLDRLNNILGNARAVMEKSDNIGKSKINPTQKSVNENTEIAQATYKPLSNGNPNLPDYIAQSFKEMPTQAPQLNEIATQPNIPNNVQTNNDKFTVSESALRGIIKDVVKDELLKFMSETFSKQLSEQTIKKTINTLIKEGKIRTKKRISS